MAGRIRVLFTAACVATSILPLYAQTVPRAEVGVDVSQFQVKYWPFDTGAGVHATIGLTQLFAIETRARWFENEPLPDVARGGTTFQLFSGGRATFASHRRVSVYGLVMPGLLRTRRP